MAATPSPQHVELALLQLPQSNNDSRKQAERFLIGLLKSPQSVPLMLQQVQGSGHRVVRQLAALLLRERIVRHWKYLNDEQRASVKGLTLRILHNETERPVIVAMASLAAALAKFLVPAQQWSELVEFAVGAAQAEAAKHREMGVMLLFFLLEIGSVSSVLAPMYSDLASLFASAMQDAESRDVRVYAMKAAGTLLESIVYDGARFDGGPLIPLMMRVAADALNDNDEDTAFHTFDVMGALASSAGSAIDPFVGDVAQFMLRVSTTVELEHSTRESAIMVLEHLACYKPRLFTKAGLAKPMLEALLQLMAEPPEDEEEVSVPPGAPAASVGPDVAMYPSKVETEGASMIAASALAAVAEALPSRHTFRPLVERVVQLAQSPDAHHRMAAAEALATSAEGLSDRYAAHMDQLLGVVLALARDAHPKVVERACFALSMFVTFIRHALDAHFDALLPQLLQLLAHPYSRVTQASAHALQSFFEEMDAAQGGKWLEPAMRAVTPLLHSPMVHSRSAAVGVVSSLAMHTEGAFRPYFQPTMELLHPMLSISDPQLLPLRCQATEALALVATAVGAESFRPHLERSISSVLQGLAFQDAQLDEFSLSFFHNLYTCCPGDLREISPQLVELIRAIVGEHDTVDVVYVRGEQVGSASLGDGAAGDGGGGAGAAAATGDDDGNDDDDDDNDDIAMLGARTKSRAHIPSTNRKVAALNTLGSIATHLPEALLPQFADTFGTVRSCLHSHIYQIRVEAADCLAVLGPVAMRAAGVERRGGFSHPAPLPPALAAQIVPVTSLMVRFLSAEPHRSTVASCCDAITAFLAAGGAAVLGEGDLQRLIESLVDLMKGEAMCQMALGDGDDGDDDDEPEGGERDHDNVVIDAVSDLIGEVARTGGAEFEPHFHGLAQAVLQHAAPSRHDKDRSMALGTFAEVFSAVGTHDAAYERVLIPLCIQCADHPFSVLRGNAAYLLGTMCSTSPDACKPHLAAILTALRSLVTVRPGEDFRVVDNANAAIARASLAFSDVLPMDQILPAVLANMPARDDHEENAKPFELVCGLLSRRDPSAMALLPDVLRAFAAAFGPQSRVPAQIRVGAAHVLRGALTEPPAQAAFSALTEEQKTILHAATEALSPTA